MTRNHRHSLKTFALGVVERLIAASHHDGIARLPREAGGGQKPKPSPVHLDRARDFLEIPLGRFRNIFGIISAGNERRHG